MKKIIALILAVLFALCIAGCSKAETKEQVSEGKPDASSAQEESSVPEKDGEASTVGMFRKGLWEVVKDGQRTGLYYFSENGTECSYHDVEKKGGVPFDYEINENGDGYIFHMGSADNNSKVSSKEGTLGSDSVILVWEDREEEIVFVEDVTYDEFAKRP